MTNDSSTGGLLLPSTSTLLEDGALDDFIQAFIVGVTGVAGNLVRPEFQPEPPDLPPFGTNWASFFVNEEDGNVFAQLVHNGAGNGGQGQADYQSHEVLEIKAQFYGPNARSNAKLLRDGLKVSQNLEYFRPQNMGLVDTGRVIAVPSLLKERWLYRADFSFRLSRQVLRTYSILNLESAVSTVESDGGASVSINVSQ